MQFDEFWNVRSHGTHTIINICNILTTPESSLISLQVNFLLAHPTLGNHCPGSTPIVLPFLEYYINGIIEFVAFWIWLQIEFFHLAKCFWNASRLLHCLDLLQFVYPLSSLDIWVMSWTEDASVSESLETVKIILVAKDVV